MLLIDDRVPPPAGPERPVWDPDWRMVGRVGAAVALGAGAAVTGGLLSFALVCGSVASAAHAAASALPYGEGLREYRQ